MRDGIVAVVSEQSRATREARLEHAEAGGGGRGVGGVATVGVGWRGASSSSIKGCAGLDDGVAGAGDASRMFGCRGIGLVQHRWLGDGNVSQGNNVVSRARDFDFPALPGEPLLFHPLRFSAPSPSLRRDQHLALAAAEVAAAAGDDSDDDEEDDDQGGQEVGTEHGEPQAGAAGVAVLVAATVGGVGGVVGGDEGGHLGMEGE